MKWKIIIIAAILMLLFDIGCGKASHDVENYKLQEFEDANGASIDEVGSDGVNGKEKKDSILTLEATGEETEFATLLNKVLSLEEGEEIEKAEWIVKDEVFRVGIKKKHETPREYLHQKDYIFVKSDHVRWIEVDYPSKQDYSLPDRYVYSACDFHVLYEDVSFDGIKDILVYLGERGPSKVYCAYVYEEGEYVYKKSFEEIPFERVDTEAKRIVGRIEDGHSYRYECEYSFTNGEFVLANEITYELDKTSGNYEPVME